MLPNVYALLAGDAAVAAQVGTRVYRFGQAPQRVTAPYITWYVVAGVPENTLPDTPVVDRWELQIDCWSDNDGTGDQDIEALALAVRNALEAYHHVTGIGPADRDPDTRRYRVSLQVTWWEDRDPPASEVTTTLWRSVYPIASGGIFDGAYIPNPDALWRVVSADESFRWSFYPGGGYVFNAVGADLGAYVLTYEVADWDGLGNDQTATVTVIVE